MTIYIKRANPNHNTLTLKLYRTGRILPIRMTITASMESARALAESHYNSGGNVYIPRTLLRNPSYNKFVKTLIREMDSDLILT